MQIAPDLLSLLGWNIQGDIAGLTCYRSARHKFIWFAAAPPKKPFTPLQLTLRQNFIDAASAWGELAQETKDRWKAAVTKAKLVISPINLWIHCQLTQDQDILDAITFKTGITLSLCEREDTTPGADPEP